MGGLRVTGGRVLVDGALREGDVLLEDGAIAALGSGAGRVFDARGLLVLPGIVDIHGDAFERQVQPRPGIDFPIGLALAETERQLLANGITTALHGITLSWEPGLRGAEMWRALLDALAAGEWRCDMRVHLLAFNDHTPAILSRLGDPAKASKYSDRGPLDLAAFRVLAERVGARGAEVVPARLRLAAAARAAGVPMASHDDDSIACRDGFRAIGARICEFPMAEDVGAAARAAGDAVVMGSPNVVRGRSHLGWASAARLAEAGVCSVLSSDYFYPCLTQAPFVLARRGVLGLAAAWALVSANPAAAAGLADRGTIAVGKRADLTVVAEEAGLARVVATITRGRLVYLDSSDRL